MTAALQIEKRHAHAPRRGTSDDERAFRRAVRHSRLVRTLRFGVPFAIVVGSAVTFAVVTLLDPLQALVKLPVDISGIVVSGTKITMQAPRLVGYTRDKRPYSVTARAAAQDVTKPDVLELQDIKATMETANRGAFQLQARSGIYDTKSEKLTLRQDIVVSSANYKGLLSEAFVEVHKGYVVSEKPVEVRMLRGTINANRLEVENSGEVIRFDRGVTMVVLPESADRTAPDAAGRKTADAAASKPSGQ